MRILHKLHNSNQPSTSKLKLAFHTLQPASPPALPRPCLPSKTRSECQTRQPASAPSHRLTMNGSEMSLKSCSVRARCCWAATQASSGAGGSLRFSPASGSPRHWPLWAMCSTACALRTHSGGVSPTPYTWAEKFESFEWINSIRETNGNFDSCNSCKRLETSRLHELHESKFTFVSRTKFIRSKLSNFSAHVYRVTVNRHNRHNVF